MDDIFRLYIPFMAGHELACKGACARYYPQGHQPGQYHDRYRWHPRLLNLASKTFTKDNLEKMIFETVINGLPVRAMYPEEDVRNIFIPFLKSLTDLQRELGRRILIFLAAPPGSGKSTLVAFLKELSEREPELSPLTVIGMDGFHRRQEYLLSHSTARDGREIKMVEIKGAPVTFDLPLFRAAIEDVSAGKDCEWPEYDRLLHNPVYGGQRVTGNIVLLEGNYLLLDEEGWRDLRAFADYTVFITADAELLRERLVARKEASGTPRDKAEQFVAFSDMYNARLCLEHSLEADLKLRLMADNRYRVVPAPPRL